MNKFEIAEKNYLTEPDRSSKYDAIKEEILGDIGIMVDIIKERAEQEQYDLFFEVIAAYKRGDVAGWFYFSKMMDEGIEIEINKRLEED